MLNHDTYPFFEKVFIYLRILVLMFVAFGIRHAGWSMYHGYLTLLFAFMKNCLPVVIITRVWDMVFILCFRGASGGSTLLTLAFPCNDGVTKVTQHHLRGYGHLNFWLRCALQPLVCRLYLRPKLL
jgi:hypothetical protein